MLGGSSQVIEIKTDPSDAIVDISPNAGHLITPGGVSLRRDSPYTVHISKDGYRSLSVPIQSETASGTWWRNLLWIHPIFWGIGVVIDLNTGAGYELIPDAISVTLQPIDPPLPKPE